MDFGSQRQPRRAPGEPKRAPRQPNRAPREPEDSQRPSQNSSKRGPVSPRQHKTGTGWPQAGAKEPQTAPRAPQETTRPAILAPLEPRTAPKEPQDRPRRGTKGAQDDCPGRTLLEQPTTTRSARHLRARPQPAPQTPSGPQKSCKIVQNATNSF